MARDKRRVYQACSTRVSMGNACPREPFVYFPITLVPNPIYSGSGNTHIHIKFVYQYSSTMQYTSLGPQGQSCGDLPLTFEAALVVRLELVEPSPRKPRHATKAAAFAINKPLFGIATRAHRSRTKLLHQSESLLVPFGKGIPPLSSCATSPYSHLSILFYL